MFGILLPGKPVATDFEQIDDTTLSMYIPQINELTNVVIFDINAEQPPDDLAYSVYMQQSKNDPIFLGQLTTQMHSISVTVGQYITEKNIESAGHITITIEALMPMVPDQFSDREKLAQVGKQMCEDLYQYVSSHDDIPFQGEHYVSYEAVENWIANVGNRIKLNQKFWNKVQ